MKGYTDIGIRKKERDKERVREVERGKERDQRTRD